MKRFLLLFLIIGCNFSSDNETPVITTVSPEDFDEAKDVTVQLAPGFQLSLWAPGPLLSNAVALSFDNNGVAYVAETSRRKSSDIDIRAHRDWMTEDIGLQSLEDTRDFHLAKLDPSLSDQNQWQEDFNKDGSHDWKDLEVQSEYVRRIWDSDGDGKADKSAIYAEGINSMLTGVAAGIMYHDGEVFVTAAPDVYRFRDTDNDGDEDEREIISHGYGIHIAYAGHDMSGLTMGPDGKVYWSIGDIGVNTVDKTGKRWAYPNQGAVMRCNPDGSDFEVFAHGLRNPQEIAFDAYGNLISVDNDGDHPGEHERFLHILEGSDTGWRTQWQYGKYNKPNEEYKIWMDEALHVPHFPGQPAYITPPIALAPNGPAGLAYNPGAALGSQYENFFFGSFFTGSSARSRIQAFKLTPKGASFALENTEDVLKGIVPTGVNFGPDGALYINDWKDGYAKKPEGRIWKLDLGFSDLSELRAQTQEILQKGMDGRSINELAEFLNHRDMRVRMNAQFALVKQSKNEILLAAATNGKNQFARLHGIWGIGQLARKEKELAKDLLPLLKDRNDYVRVQAAKVLGENSYAPARDQLIAQLKDEYAQAQYYAAEALGKIGDKAAFDPLVNLLAEIEESDPHLRHGIVLALARINDVPAITALTNHESHFVRIGATVALRELKSPAIADFLNDSEPLVVVEAARGINDDLSISEALPALAKAISRTEIKEEAFVRRAINANLRLGDNESAERLAAFANNSAASPEMRADALWALGYWDKPPVLDRIDNRYRKLAGGNLKEAQVAIASSLAVLLNSQNTILKTGAIQAIGRLNIVEQESSVMKLLANASLPVESRNAALITLGEINSPNIEAALKLALADKNRELRETAQNQLGILDLPAETVVAMLERALENGSVTEQQKVLASLSTIDSPAAEALLSTWMDELAAGKLKTELQLDVLMAIEKSSFESLKTRQTAYETEKASEGVLGEFGMTMKGGNIRKGDRVFYRNNSAQCIRCHKIGNAGGEVGPSLTNIASVLSPEELLTSLIEPSARIAPGYGTIEVELNDGKKIIGILEADNNGNLTLNPPTGDPIEIAAKDIKSRKNYPSGMFSMKGILTKEEIRDLMAFLGGLR